MGIWKPSPVKSFVVDVLWLAAIAVWVLRWRDERRQDAEDAAAMTDYGSDQQPAPRSFQETVDDLRKNPF
jgi:hypothetical protein